MTARSNCLVLGGAGFLGRHLIEHLLADGHFVRVYDQVQRLPKIVTESDKNIDVVGGNFLHSENFESAMSEIDVIYHLISTSLPGNSNNDVALDAESNLIPTIRLLDRARQSKIKKIVFFSSGGTVYGQSTSTPVSENHPTKPLCAYGVHKLGIELYLSLYHEVFGLDYSVLRISNPFGEYQKDSKSQGVIPIFLQKIMRDEELEVWGDGGIVRDYVHVDDVMRAAVSILSYVGKEKIFNVGSGIGFSLISIIKLLEDLLEKEAKVSFTAGRLEDVKSNVLDISKIKSELGWMPNITLEEGIKRLVSDFS